MAEGWTRHLKGDLIEARSAGIEPGSLDPRAVRVMAESEVDISGQRPKHVSTLGGEPFDCVITVCDRAREVCPVFPAPTATLHVGFEDPPCLAVDAGDEERALEPYRRVRDEIRAFVEGLPGRLGLMPGDAAPFRTE
jgi:arsenate reductase